VPKVSDSHREARRHQIVDGARRAFARHGYEGATVPVLEKEIGLSRGAIFSYFPSKLDLFEALAREDRERILRRWIEEGHEGLVRHIAEAPEWIGVYLDVPRLLRSDPELRERWTAMNPELNETLERRFADRVAAGEIRDDVPLETIGRFLGMVCDGLAVQLGAGFGGPVDLDGMLELLRAALAPK
jgi:TetR/AcrR family transcriptional regulator, transcriptional repressor of aconitase